MGYPGGTTRYRESQSIIIRRKVNFPFLAEYLQARANALGKVGEDDEAKRIKFQGDIQSYIITAKFTKATRRSQTLRIFLSEKRNEESKFASWVNANPRGRQNTAKFCRI
jgi:hypothetical protein